jgi:membrane-bound lytic murein transglycosylase F
MFKRFYKAISFLLSITIYSLLLNSSVFSQTKQTLRVLTWAGTEAYLPRAGDPQVLEKQFLHSFAENHDLQFEEVVVEDFSDLIPMLLAGKGDVISANLTETHTRRKQVSFTDPFIQTYEYLVMGKNSKALKNGKSLNGREIVLQKGKSYGTTAAGLKKVYPKLKIRYIENNISNEQIFDRLASGEYDITIQDRNLILGALAYRDDIKMSLQASGKRYIGWAVAPSNTTLLQQLNEFLKKQALTVKGKSSIKTQWQRIKQRKAIRFVLRNNLSSYYVWRGELLGFHYELAKRFAKEHKLRYEIIVAPNNVALLDYLIADKADIALGFLTPTEKRRQKGISFSRPYHYASELVIAHKDKPEIIDQSELAGSTFHLRESSAYWQTALQLQKVIKNIDLKPVPETQETESILDYISEKKYDYTIADSHIVDIELTFRDNIHSLMSIGEPKSQSWAFKKGNSELLKEADRFIKKHYKGLFYNVIYNKYFKNPRRLDVHYNDYELQQETGTISPFDDEVKKYAKQFNFDWRLLVAQMHQESRFNPNAKSMAGAQGLFQVMPRTAKELGIKDMHKPDQSIEAGVRYMDWVRDRMEKNDVNDDQLIWFTLASYNAGIGHVRDAMRLARQKGWDPTIWFDNVEKAMLLLSEPKYAAKARYGYVRGREPVHYIYQIKKRFDTYKNTIPE